MGFMDKFKDAAKQAQDATKAAGGSLASMGGMDGAADTAAKTNRIAQHGVKHPAVLKGMRETGNKDPLSGGAEYELEVEVKPTGGDSYSATFTQQLIAQSVDGYKEKLGGEIVVNVDPDDPQSMMLWG
jgi:hypothetical protein